jgi:hypothetical protein
MRTFSEANTQEIMKTIRETRHEEEFNEFARRLLTIQENMKEFNTLENQHGMIFEKVNENTQILIRIREDIGEEKESLKGKTLTLREIKEEINEMQVRKEEEI